jgi:uncharacterized protein
MAKKRATAKRRTPRKTRRPDLTIQLLKIFSGLSLLIVLLVGAGILAYHALHPSPGQAPSAARAPSSTQKTPAPAAKKVPPPPVAKVPLPKAAPQTTSERSTKAPTSSEKKPTYEVFPKEPVPKPLVKMTPLPGKQPPIAAIIVDDIGYDRQMGDLFLSLDVPLTFALLPHAPFGRAFLAKARAAGHEIMLHLPMEPNEYPAVDPGPGALLAHMSPDRLIAELEDNLDQIDGIKGVNNHMGSRLSASPEHMRQIFSVLKRRGLYYIDSRTSAETVAHSSARLFQIPFAERDIFIDHQEDPQFIRAQITRLIKRAQKQGYAVGIAHPHANTYKALKEMLPQLLTELQLVPASMVVEAVTYAQTQKLQTLSGDDPQ